MEMYTMLPNTFAWNPAYEDKIEKETWEKLTGGILALTKRAADIHEARCRTGNLDLESPYLQTLESLRAKVEILKAVSQDILLEQHTFLLDLAYTWGAEVDA